jgi:hypothetical protein
MRVTYLDGSAQAIRAETTSDEEKNNYQHKFDVNSSELNNSRHAGAWARITKISDPIRENVCTKSDTFRAQFLVKVKANRALAAKFDNK